MMIILFIFVLVYSGLVSLCGVGEKLIGERVYCVLYVVLFFFFVVFVMVSVYVIVSLLRWVIIFII